MRPPEADVERYFTTLSNWGRWGEDDELGTLNLISAEKRRAAFQQVSEASIISCSRPVSTAEPFDHRSVFQRYMISSGDASPPNGPGTASEWFGLRYHGQEITHLDALAHYHWDQRMYNGHPASRISTVGGAEVLSVTAAREGIATRGVLLDIPRSRGEQFLPLDFEIGPDDLDRCEQQQGVHVEGGDALLVNTGRARRTYDQSIGWAGLRADCLPWLRERDVAVLVGDHTHDCKPPVYDKVRSPVHNVAIAALGLWLVDNAYLDDLVRACEKRERWSFLFLTSPLVLERTTGSPVNPLAVF